MRFYDCRSAPSPRRVRLFAAEKGIVLDTIQVDLRTGEHRTPAFAAINPWQTVPVIRLDDGTTISEAIACCRYLEAAFPEPPLMGRTPAEVGVVAMWEHRCELDGFFAVAEAFRNATPGMQGRALAGPLDHAQIPQLAERGRARAQHFLALLEARLAESPFVAGEAYSVADITAFVTVEFAAWAKILPTDDQRHLHRWLEVMRARPSAAA